MFDQCNDFYTFFVISNINSKHSVFTPDQRFLQTLETLDSLKSKVPNLKIIFSDNSDTPLDHNQKTIIESQVNLFVTYENNLFTHYVNKTGTNKGLNELLVYEKMLNESIKHNLVGKRIFKISGRYKLKDIFDIYEYEKPEYFNKYVFRITHWVYNYTRPVGSGEGDITKYFFNTALWSMCSTLIPDYKILMGKIFNNMLLKNENIEVSHHDLVPKEKLKLVQNVHGYGFITNGEATEF